MDRNLVFDIGAHRGEDSEFYLKKGFRVVGVEANMDLCQGLGEKLKARVESGQFTIVNKAVALQPGRLKFYVNTKNSVWGTVNAEWAERNRRQGAGSRECEVEATTIGSLVREFGVPYYAKIDIEGNDMVVVDGFTSVAERPKYISIESDKDSFRGLRRELTTLTALGYDQFNIVDQMFGVPRQQPPNPAKEGVYAPHQFSYGSSGLFGDELPGPWVTADEALETYRSIFLRYALTGDDPFVRNSLVRNLLRRTGFRSSWYDTHARRSTAR